MRKLILVSFVLMFTSGCTVIWKEDMLAMSFFAGAVVGNMDPNTGAGSWTRVGEYEASGIEIIKDGDDYVIQFDKSESRTEFDKMKFFFEAGFNAAAGAAL